MSEIIRVVIVVLLACLFGCAGISPATQADLQAARNQFAVQQQNVQQKAAADLQAFKDDMAKKAAAGQLAPATHPFDAMNSTIAGLLPPLRIATIALAVVAAGVWLASFFFTTITFLPKLALALTKLDILSLSVLLALPFIKWAVLIMLGGFALMYLCEAIRDHFDLRQAAIDTLATVGIKMGETPAAAVANAKVAAANPPRVPIPKKSPQAVPA